MSYAEGSGSVDLFVEATGKTDHGLVWGHLTFKLANHDRTDQPPFQGELRFCHEISNVVCDAAGGICFTTRTFALQKMMGSGTPPVTLGSLSDLPEPWPFAWELRCSAAPRTLEGCLKADNPGRTNGTLRLVKADST
jgi:hypothetical protein